MPQLKIDLSTFKNCPILYGSRILDINDPETFFKNARDFFANEDHVVCMDSNGYADPYAKFSRVLAAGAVQVVSLPFSSTTVDQEELEKQIQKLTPGDWWFGYFSYDLKNCFEQLVTENEDHLEAELLYFFQPKWVITEDLFGTVCFHGHGNSKPSGMVDRIVNGTRKTESVGSLSRKRYNDRPNNTKTQVPLLQQTSQQRYLQQVKSLLGHIQRGDIYEVNYCTQFLAESTSLDMVALHEELLSTSSPPFSVYLKTDRHEVSSLSPERYICKRGDKLISQPIKGTARRSEFREEDECLKNDLFNDPKERSENIMIVDLVRNDLSKVATKGSVVVDELCKVYSFPQVHQMISTISCKLRAGVSLFDIIKASFPMGSMTGAPKISAMQLIEKHEDSRRGIYSGAIGYLSPDGDFDFNVVIRSVVHYRKNRNVSFHVGSAITALSEPKKEYEECLVKAKALIEALKKQGLAHKEVFA